MEWKNDAEEEDLLKSPPTTGREYSSLSFPPCFIQLFKNVVSSSRSECERASPFSSKKNIEHIFQTKGKMAPIIFLAKPGQVFECPFECRSPLERFWTLGCWNNNRCVSVRRVMSVREAYRVLYSIPLSDQILRGHLDRQNIFNNIVILSALFSRPSFFKWVLWCFPYSNLPFNSLGQLCCSIFPSCLLWSKNLSLWFERHLMPEKSPKPKGREKENEKLLANIVVLFSSVSNRLGKRSTWEMFKSYVPFENLERIAFSYVGFLSPKMWHLFLLRHWFQEEMMFLISFSEHLIRWTETRFWLSVTPCLSG